MLGTWTKTKYVFPILPHLTSLVIGGGTGVGGSSVGIFLWILSTVHFFSFSLALFFLHPNSWSSSRFAPLSMWSPKGFLLKAFALLLITFSLSALLSFLGFL